MLVCVLNPRPVLFPSESPKSMGWGNIVLARSYFIYQFKEQTVHESLFYEKLWKLHFSLENLWVCLIFFLYLTHRIPMSSSCYNTYRWKESNCAHLCLSIYLTYLSDTHIFRAKHMLFLKLTQDIVVHVHLLSQKVFGKSFSRAISSHFYCSSLPNSQLRKISKRNSHFNEKWSH